MFMERHASKYGGYVGRDNTIKTTCERYTSGPTYCKDTISVIMRLACFYFSLIYTFLTYFSKFTLEQNTDNTSEVFPLY